MKKILIVLLTTLCLGITANAQVSVSDSLINDVFLIKVNGSILKGMPKNCCYADRNSAGNIAIKMNGTDKLVTSYQAPSVYVVNGQTSSDATTVMNYLNIIMTKLESILRTKD